MSTISWMESNIELVLIMSMKRKEAYRNYYSQLLASLTKDIQGLVSRPRGTVTNNAFDMLFHMPMSRKSQ